MCSMPLEEDSYGENQMTYQEQTLLMIKGHIATLPSEQRVIVNECVATIRDVLALDRGRGGKSLTPFVLGYCLSR